MKKTLLFIIGIAVFSTNASAQYAAKEKQNAIIEQYKDFYKVEEQKVVFTKVIDSISGTTSEIFTKVISYMAMNYNSANDVIQQQDKEAGIVIGKGLFLLTKSIMTCQHTIRIDIKANRVRVLIFAEKYYYTNPQSDIAKYVEIEILDSYPFNTKNYFGMVPTQRFIADSFFTLCKTIENTFANIENSLKLQNTIDINDNW